MDYNGFRLLCSAVLPLGKTTLRYGSNDGGVTCKNESPELMRKIKKACKWLNLRKHMVARGKYNLLLSHSCARFPQFFDIQISLWPRCDSSSIQSEWLNGFSTGDLEGHQGDDGKFYVVGML